MLLFLKSNPFLFSFYFQCLIFTLLFLHMIPIHQNPGYWCSFKYINDL